MTSIGSAEGRQRQPVSSRRTTASEPPTHRSASGPAAADGPDIDHDALSAENRGLDPDGRYALPFGTRVLQRARHCIQIGTDPPRTVVVRNAPAQAADVLGGLDGGRTITELLVEHRQLGDRARWLDLLDQLLSAGVLLPTNTQERAGSPMTVGAHLSEERALLTHRHGHATAARILQARDDALVVIRGDGDVAFAITAHLAAAGIGHLHQDPLSLSVPWLPEDADIEDPGTAESGLPPGRWVELRARFPALRLHSPAAHQHPTGVVLIGGPVPDLALGAAYSRACVPHLSVATGMARVVVGPFVLPGRSTCLSCLHRHRTDADPEWPAVAGQLRAVPRGTPAVLTAAGVCLAVGEMLEHIDGVQPPRTVDGTLEWRAGAPGPRRRSWRQHPDCGCRGALPE